MTPLHGVFGHDAVAFHRQGNRRGRARISGVQGDGHDHSATSFMTSAERLG